MVGSTGKKSFVAEINVVPYVDVMLVLLIIFMITAPMMTEGIEVDLPQTRAVEALPTDTDHVVLTIRRDNVIFLNEIETGIETLATQLVTVVKNPGRILFLQADREVPYGIVVDVMGRIRAAGIENLGIVAEREDDVLPPLLPDNTPDATAPSARPAGGR
jgi:biopolymer transport protein TolR